MEKVKYGSSNNALLIVLIAISAIGTTMSIGQYGMFLPLLVVLIYKYFEDNNKRINRISDIDIKLYLSYVAIFFICTLFNGDSNNGRTSLIINYMVCVLIYILISKEISSRKVIDQIIDVLLYVGVANCLLTIAQYHNMPFSWSIWYFFNDAATVKQASMIENMGGGVQMLGKSQLFCPGIFPSAVLNGYIVATLSVFGIYKYYVSRKRFEIIKSILIIGVLLYSAVIIQQRMAFLLVMLSYAAIIYTRNKILTVLLILVALASYLFYGDLNINEQQIGRLAKLSDGSREQLYTEGYNYVLNHLLFGGRVGFAEANRLSVHNVFLNAFMYGGLFGGILIIVIYMRMCYRCFVKIIGSFKGKLNQSVILAYALLIYNLISLTHNNSLLTGDPIIWVLYALMLISAKLEYNEQKA